MADYEPFTLGLSTYRHLASRKEAISLHERLMSCRYERIEQLRAILADAGQDLCLDPSCLQMLNDWFVTQVELRDPTLEERKYIEDLLGEQACVAPEKRLTAYTESACIDCALLIGEVLIKEAPHLHWTMVTKPKNDVSYQKTVLAGFQKVRNRQYHVDIERVLVSYAYGISSGTPGIVRPTRPEKGVWDVNKFVHTYESCLRIA